VQHEVVAWQGGVQPQADAELRVHRRLDRLTGTRSIAFPSHFA
jgi:hypothetical protein